MARAERYVLAPPTGFVLARHSACVHNSQHVTVIRFMSDACMAVSMGMVTSSKELIFIICFMLCL